LKNILRIPIFKVALSGVMVFVITLGLDTVRNLDSSAPDFNCGAPSDEEVLIRIQSGEAGSSVGASLADAGVIKSSEAYFRLAVADARAAKVAPGTHRLQKNLCSTESLKQLLDSSRIVGLINISEGMWVDEVLPQMYRAGIKKEDVKTALQSLIKPSGFDQLEGLLFPAQYSFASTTPAGEALASMVARAEAEMRIAGFYKSNTGYTAAQLLVIASLIQAEGSEKDFSKVSQVVRNRLRKGMPLQFDSTVHYVMQSRGTIFLSTKSTMLSSSYNTYRKYGLPPGPINNPGAAAMRAAVTPQEGDWLYFITVAPGDTRFTADIAQFNTWKYEYKKNLRAGKFRSQK
jgi:UPF0755 protein